MSYFGIDVLHIGLADAPNFQLWVRYLLGKINISLNPKCSFVNASTINSKLANLSTSSVVFEYICMLVFCNSFT